MDEFLHTAGTSAIAQNAIVFRDIYVWMRKVNPKVR